MRKKRKTCGDSGGITTRGNPCELAYGHGVKPGDEKGDVPGRCINHRAGIVRLTPWERRFVEAYCGSAKFNGKRAAEYAGSSSKYPKAVAWNTLQKPYVIAAIEKRMNDISMREAEILARLTAIARGDLSPFLEVDESGQTFVLDLASEEAQANLFLIRKLNQIERFSESDGEGEGGGFIAQRRTEIELHDAKDALKQLAKIRGLLIQKHELTGANGGPIEVDAAAVRERLLRRISGIAARIGPPEDYQRVRGNGDRGT